MTTVLGIIALAVGLTLAAQLLVRRLPALGRFKGNDVVGFYLGLVGVLYAVALTFVMVAAWENQDHTRSLIDAEAQTLGSIGYLARGMPQPLQGYAIEQTREYARTVVNDEWPSLERGQESRALDRVGARLGLAILRFAPKDDRGAALDAQALSAFESLRSLRRERRAAANYRVPGPLWALLVFGAAITLGLCFLFEVESRAIHLGGSGLAAAYLALSLLITWDLQDPFRGATVLSAEPFSHLLEDDLALDDRDWERLGSEVPGRG